jgi:hypothetical protein
VSPDVRANMKQQIKTFLAGGFLALALFGAATAGPLEDGEAAYKRSDFSTALQILRPLADQGNEIAQAYLGLAYRQGYGVPHDDAQAAAWFRKAADEGYAPAQGVLGEMYRDGRGVSQDYVRAHMWLNLAVARSDDATHQMSVKVRDEVAAKMTPNQIVEAQSMASEWMRAHEPPVTAPPISADRAVPMVREGGTFKVPVTITATCSCWLDITTCPMFTDPRKQLRKPTAPQYCAR